MGCCPQSGPRAVRAIPQGACHDARRQIGMTQSPVPTRNRPPHLGTRAVCPCLQFNTKTPQPISVCLEHAPEAATPAQTKYLWVIERCNGGLLATIFRNLRLLARRHLL